jgi:ParB family transcriptional regulator, chromosome partitioning protein
MSTKRDQIKKNQQRNLESLQARIRGDSTPRGASRLLISDIAPDPNQPRHDLNQKSLEALSSSIRKSGVLQPIIVEPLEDGKFRIIAGERRWRAAQLAGLDDVPVTIRNDLNPDMILEIQLEENLFREDLNPIERVLGIVRLISKRTGWDQKEVELYFSKRVRVGFTELNDSAESVLTQYGISAGSFYTFHLRLLKLPEELHTYVRDKQLSPSAAAAIQAIQNHDVRQQVLLEAIEEQLSRSEIRKRAQSLSAKINRQASKAVLRQMQRDLAGIKKQVSNLQPDLQDWVSSQVKQIKSVLATGVVPRGTPKS